MKSTFLVFAFLIVLVASKEGNSNFILGGSNATIEEFPYMAGVLRLRSFLCTGMVINSRSVITVTSKANCILHIILYFQTAHCFLNNLSLTITVFVGSSRRQGDGGETYRSQLIIPHPEYDEFAFENDIGIIRTIGTIQFGDLVQPIQLASQLLPGGVDVVLTGWTLGNDVRNCKSTLNIGYSIQLQISSTDQLQQLNMTTLTKVGCQSLLPGFFPELVTSQNICTVLEGEERRGACLGQLIIKIKKKIQYSFLFPKDFGGEPVIWQGLLVGIASWTLRPCWDHPTVFTRVANFLDWIHQNSQNTEIILYSIKTESIQIEQRTKELKT